MENKIIPVPEELKGKVATGFLEYVKDNTTYDMKRFGLCLSDLIDFFSQPFFVEMLVNPIIISLGNDDYQGINSAFKEQYQQAEEMRLFEGWDFKETKSFLDFSDGEGRIVWSKKANNLFTLNNKFAYGDNITLNGFITLCNLTGVKLQFKKLQNAKRD